MGTNKTILEGTWDCGDCSTKGILGRTKQCPQCGSPREKGRESHFDFSRAVEVDSSELATLAGGGADWFCASCSSSNRGDVTLCRNCQAPRDGKAQIQPSGQLIGGKPEPEASAQGVQARVASKRKIPWRWVFMASLALLGVFTWWGMQTSRVDGFVESMSWQHQLVVELFAPVVAEDWSDRIRPRPPRMPRRGSGEEGGAMHVRDCQSRFRHHVKTPCGQETVCRSVRVKRPCGTEPSCETRDLGNGFAEKVCHDVPKVCDEVEQRCQPETRYCDQPVYGSWCRYDTYQWKVVFDETVSGEGTQARWPDRVVQSLEREKRKGSYTVSVGYSLAGQKKTWGWKFTDEALFRRLKPGSSVELDVRNWGGVGGVRVK